MAQELTKRSSTEQQSTLVETATHRLWERFENRYGSLWMDRWAGLPLARVKAEWADELKCFTLEALRYGFESVKDSPYPPTLPEFVAACRRAPRPGYVAIEAPKIDKETAKARLSEIRARMGRVE